jgi:DNA-binding CsgD family transcriptional regulator
MGDRRDSHDRARETVEVDAGADRSAATDDTELGLALLLAVSDRLRSWVSFKQDIERLLGDVAGPLAQPAAALWLPRAEVLVARAAWSSGEVERLALDEWLRDLTFERGDGLSGLAWTHGQPVSDSAMSGATLPSFGRLRATVAIPALAGTEVLGVVELYCAAPLELSSRLANVLGTVAHELGAFFARRRGELDLSPLTAREVEVLSLAASGLPVSGIGERLTISRGTVKSHLEHIYGKFGVVNRTAAVAHALRAGLIE